MSPAFLADEWQRRLAAERLENAEFGADSNEHVVDKRAVVFDVLVPREGQRRRPAGPTLSIHTRIRFARSTHGLTELKRKYNTCILRVENDKADELRLKL